jgi:hypothetical protein
LANVFEEFNFADLNKVFTTIANEVLEDLKKSPEHLTTVLEKLDPANLNALLTTAENGILEDLKKTSTFGLRARAT